MMVTSTELTDAEKGKNIDDRTWNMVHELSAEDRGEILYALLTAIAFQPVLGTVLTTGLGLGIIEGALQDQFVRAKKCANKAGKFVMKWADFEDVKKMNNE